jgi:hypothetical protein
LDGLFLGTYETIWAELDGHKYEMYVGHNASGSQGTTQHADEETSKKLGQMIGGSPKNG